MGRVSSGPDPDLVYVLVSPHRVVALEGHGVLPDEQVLKRPILLCGLSWLAVGEYLVAASPE